MEQHQERNDFGGVPGNLALIVVLPLLVYYLYFCLRYNDGRLFPAGVTRQDVRAFSRDIVPTGRALLGYGVWICFQAVLQAFVPGRKVFGRVLEGGARLEYRMNGLASFLITIGMFWLLVLRGWIEPRAVLSEIGPLISAAMIFAYGFSLFLYLYGRLGPAQTTSAPGTVHRFFMGCSLNPRVGSFDLKLFFEARPSLIGWILLTWVYASVQYQATGTVSTSMVLVCLFQFAYVLDYFLHEEAILSTMDIVHDPFGFMLCFGDAVWVPFTYSLQAYHLIGRVRALPTWTAVLFALLFAAGYLIFRIANLQKHRFRKDPSRPIWGRPPEYIQTEQGNKLLASGFWGWSRHFNYVGDILMAAAWSLPCLFGSLLPYFYPLYFTILLVHRERRDYRRCRSRYGEAWEEYCRRVRWRILPGLY